MWCVEDEEHADAWWKPNDWLTASSSRWRRTGGSETSSTEGCWSKRVVNASRSEKPEKRKREGGKDHEKKGHESKCAVHSRRLKRMKRLK